MDSINNNKASRLLHLNINEKSYDNDNKNGMIIDNKSNNNIYPEIKLNNYKSTTDILTKVNLGIGFNLNDSNNRIFIKKNNNLFGTFITILNNNQFNNDDIGKKIIYKDSNIQSDEIKSLINNKQAFITINNSNQEVSEFNYKKLLFQEIMTHI